MNEIFRCRDNGKDDSSNREASPIHGASFPQGNLQSGTTCSAAIQELISCAIDISKEDPSSPKTVELSSRVSSALKILEETASGADIVGLLEDLRSLRLTDQHIIKSLADSLCQRGTPEECIQGFRALAAMRIRDQGIIKAIRNIIFDQVSLLSEEELSHIARGWSRLVLDDKSVPQKVCSEIVRRNELVDGEAIGRLIGSLGRIQYLEGKTKKILFGSANKHLHEMPKEALLSLISGLSNLSTQCGETGATLMKGAFQNIAQSNFSLSLREVDRIVRAMSMVRFAPPPFVNYLISQIIPKVPGSSAKECADLLIAFAKIGVRDDTTVEALYANLVECSDTLSNADRIGAAWALEVFGFPRAKELIEPILHDETLNESLPRGFLQYLEHLCTLHELSLPTQLSKKIHGHFDRAKKRLYKTSSFQLGVEMKLKSLGASYDVSVKFHGIEVDIVLKLKDGRLIAIECDGEPFHSTEVGMLGRDVMKTRLLRTHYDGLVRIRTSEDSHTEQILANVVRGILPEPGQPGYAPLEIPVYTPGASFDNSNVSEEPHFPI